MAGRQASTRASALAMAILGSTFSLELWGWQQPVPFVADALNWYHLWGTDQERPLTAQRCSGEFRNPHYVLRCDPLGVVAEVLIEKSGCSIIFMGPPRTPWDGTRASVSDERSSSKFTCGELPTTDGAFRFTVTPRTRPVDEELSRAARKAAVRFLAGSEGDLYFPRVRRGDPFFHVYLAQRGVVSEVLEFRIAGSAVAEFPHWTCTSRKKDLPRGSDRRLRDSSYWFDKQEQRPR